MRKTYKKIIAFCAVLIFALALIPVQTFALGDPFSAIAVGGIGGASGAGLFGSMASASGISIGFPSGTTSDPCDALWNSLNPDHVYFSGEKGQVTEPDPVTGVPTVYDYISVNIEDWLQAQNDFIDEFVSNYQVTDNSSGSISVPISYKGLALPYDDGFGRKYLPTGGEIPSSPTLPLNYSFSDFSLTLSNIGYGSYNLRCYQNNSSTGNQSASSGNFVNANIVLASYGGKIGLAPQNKNTGSILWYQSCYSGSTGVDAGYTGNWTSTTVNTGVFDGYSAAKVKIPASSWSPSDPTNWNVAEFLEELTIKMVSDHASDIIIEDDNPTPPPVPIPSTPLGDIPTDEWYDLFGLPVLEGQEEIHQDLQDFSSDVSEGINDVVGELEDIESDVESIDTNIGIGNGLLGDLKSIGQSIQSTLSSILSGVTDLVQEIVLSTETFIAGLLNSIMGGLGGMFSTMREAFSIWHYVVEWVGSISTVFSWFWSVAGSTSYYIQLPIYASLAGAVVLAFYKRFGK